jgi:hypothetical protein
MRKVISGSGADTTSTVAAYLAAGNEFTLANLYLIGDLDDPQAVWLTDWEAPLSWPVWGTFQPSVISRGTIESKIGLAVADLQVEWTPKLIAPTSSIATANPYQLAQLGFFDNKLFRCWITFMPTAGDANTYGASSMFGGRIGKSEVKRGKITFTVNSFLDVVNEMVPTNVIELTNTSAGYRGATPPPGDSSVPQFNVMAGSTQNMILGDETTPTAHHLYTPDGSLQGAFLIFNGGSGATLARQLARIADNFNYAAIPNHLNQFILYDPLPWAPTPGVDTFYVSAPYPINQQDGSYEGFPYVPAPQAGL